MDYQPGLNERVALEERMGAAFAGARRIHLAAAYATLKEVATILEPGGLGVPEQVLLAAEDEATGWA